MKKEFKIIVYLIELKRELNDSLFYSFKHNSYLRYMEFKLIVLIKIQLMFSYQVLFYFNYQLFFIDNRISTNLIFFLKLFHNNFNFYVNSIKTMYYKYNNYKDLPIYRLLKS